MSEQMNPVELATALKSEVGTIGTRLGALEGAVKGVEEAITEARGLITAQRARAEGYRVRRPGRPSVELASLFGAMAVCTLHDQGMLRRIAPHREAALRKDADGILQRAPTALTTSNVALPEEYGAELRELIGDYGVARQYLTRFPIGAGTARPARLTTGLSDFTFMAQSAEFDSKVFTAGYASLESHKIGGIVTVPRELMEQGAVDIGTYLLTYGARRFAKKEDYVALLANGTDDATHGAITGIAKLEDTATNEVILGSGELSPGDVTVDDFRNLRGEVDAAVLGTAAYFMHPTWERKLRALNTEADPAIYVSGGPGMPAKLDGWPIVWSHIMQAFTTADITASTYLAIFGDLSWFWLGEHGVPRIDSSDQVRFLNDEIVFRFIEEIDIDYSDLDAAAVLTTAAS